jgi:hypothetical protein
MNAVHQLPDLLQGGWWFGPGHAAAPPAQPAPHFINKQPSSWWWPFGGGDSQPQATNPTQRTQNGTRPRISRPRSMPANLDAAGKAQPRSRPPRVASASRLQSRDGTGQAPQTTTAGEAETAPLDANGTAAAAAASKKPSSRQLKPEGLPKPSAKPNGVSRQAASKQLSYQERRRLWRER